MFGDGVCAEVEDENIKKTRYGEGDVDGDLEDALETFLLLLLFICCGDHHCEDDGDSCQD